MASTTGRRRAPKRSDDEETRAIAAMTFDAMPVDWDAFTAERCAQRGHEDGVLNRFAQVVMSKNDVELTAMVKDACRKPHPAGEPDGFDVTTKMIDTFAERAAFLREAAAVFDSARTRLVVALHRAALQLDDEAAA